MSVTRRFFLQQTAKLFFAINFIIPRFAWGKWPQQFFAEGSLEQTVKRLFNDAEFIDTNKINIQLPRVAENGAIVPIKIKSSLENIEKIYILIEKNPVPLAAEFQLSPEVAIDLSARLKMAESCQVIVVASSGDKLYRNQRFVKVTVGGCGG